MLFAFSEAIAVRGAYPSCDCCFINYCASELAPVLEFGFESTSFSAEVVAE